ncbi:hypothetical protein Tco_0986037 [Tanacetum coccineum]
MGQYLTHTDYALWEVIMNGDAPAIASASTEGHIPLKTVEQKLARKNELKAKSTLLLAIPDEHLLKFHGIKGAKAIKARSEGLGKSYDRFQKLISQSEIHGEVISQCMKLRLKANQAQAQTLRMWLLYLQMILAVLIPAASLKRQAFSSTYADDVMFSFFVN